METNDINRKIHGKPMTAAELLDRHSISSETCVREAMASLNRLSGESMTLFVVEPGGFLKGTVTDGDIRRYLISGGNLGESVSPVMNRNFRYAEKDTLSGKDLEEARRLRISLLPVLEKGKIIDIIDLNTMKTLLPVDAVLMAGGRGERLRPLTDNVPKPLLKVGGKAVIDHNVDELERCGIDRIFVTVNYLAEKIEDHFRERTGRSKVLCVREPVRLGTFGSLNLIEGLENDTVLVMNSDLLTTIDYESLYLNHIKSGYEMTVAAVPYSVSVPYAILRTEGGRIQALEEKPTFNYFANGGVYIMQRELIERIKSGEYLDAPDFISSYIADGGNVGLFPIEGTWIDIGSPDDYRYANELYTHHPSHSVHNYG